MGIILKLSKNFYIR